MSVFAQAFATLRAWLHKQNCVVAADLEVCQLPAQLAGGTTSNPNT